MVVETEDSTNFRGAGSNVANSAPSFAPQGSSETRPVAVPQNQGAGQPIFAAASQPAQPQSIPVKPQSNPDIQTPNLTNPAPTLDRPIALRPATSTTVAPATVPLFARPQQPTVQSMSAPPPRPASPPAPTTQTSLSQQNQTQKQTYQAPSFSRGTLNQASAPPPKPPKQRRKLSPLAKRIGVGVLALLLVVGGSFAFFVSQTQQNSKTANTNTDPASRFDTLQLPLSELAKAGAINLEGGKTLSINGQLRVNNTLVLTPSGQPKTGISGQIYYDQADNVLEYYNGTEFVKIASGTSLVQSLGGLTGAISVSGGLSASGNTITNSGVLSLQGQTGAVTLTAGNGITIDGTTVSNSGVLTIGGQAGSINLGAGLSVSGGELKNSGVVGVTAGTNITVVNNGNGSYTINSSAGGGNVSTAGGTSGKIAKFTGVNTIADSLISETGGSIIISGNLDVTGQLDLGTPLEVINGGTGTNTLAANGVLIGNGISAVSAVTAGGTGLCFMSTAGAPAFSACPSAAGVDALNGLTGTLTIANASAAGSTITINDASTSQKGIASFNSTNFSASSGAINTIQDINTTATPTFGRLTVTSSQAASTMMLINNTNAAASGNLLDLQTNSVTQMSISPAGAMTLVGTINGQTISSTANFTGTLGVSGLASLSGGATVTGTLTANTITPTSSMTVGATGQSLLLQGNALTSLEATDSGNTTKLSFVTPTADVTYRLQTAAAGTYDICTTVGNCAGTGGGVTTLGGTTNRLSKFTGSQTIGDSIITDNGSTVTIGGTLSVNTLTPTGSLTVGATAQNFLLQGSATSTITSTDSGNTTTLSFQTPTANVIYRLPTAVAGTYDLCTTIGNCAGTGGGVTTLGGTAGRIAKFTAAQTIADSLLSETGSTVTVNGTLTANTITPTASMTVGATAQSFLLQGSATSTITSTDSGNTTTLSFVAPTANVTYRLQTATAGTYDICSSANNCGYANAALSNLSSVAINTTLLPGSAGTIDVGSNMLPFRDIYVAGSSATPGTNNFRITGTATGARTITLPDASGTVCIDTNNCNYVSLQASSPGTAQTGNINVGGTIIAGTSMQAPLLQTADATSGSTAALTMRTGNLTGGSSTSTGDVTIRSGNASGTATNSGNISIDVGTATGTKGALSVGTANASAVNLGNTAAALSVYGTSASTMTFQNGANTTTLSFQAPTANVTYRFPATTAGSYDICTSVGNCAGSGGGVTTPGGTSGKIAKFTGSQTIADSLLSESGTVVSVDGDLNLTSGHLYKINNAQISSADLSNDANLAKLNLTQTFTGATNSFKNSSDSTNAFNIQNTGSQSLLTADTTGNQIILGTASSLAGKLTFQNASNINTISLIPAVATGTRTITLPDESGTICTTGSVCSGYAPSGGGTGYIQNTTTVQTNANIAIQSAADTSITMLIRERAAQSADILRIEDSSSNYQLRLDAYGALHVAQNASFDSYVGVGTSASSGEQLRIGVANASTIAFNIYGNGAQTADLLRITAGGAQPIMAVSGSGQASFQNRTNSTTALTVSNATSQSILRVDTTNNRVVIGDTTGAAGGIGITNGTYASTITSSALTADRSIAIPDESGTICLQSSTACGFAASSGGAGYIQNQIASQQSGSNFWISGIGRADTSLQSPLLDTATAIALNIGTTNATAINLNQNTTVTAGKQLIVTSALTTLTGATTGDALAVSNSTSTGNIAVFKDDSTTVATIANGGATTFQNNTDSTTAFRVLSSAGSSLFSIDSTNGGAASLLGMNSGETGSWSSGATTLTGTRGYAGTAIANGYAYVVGGNSGTTPQATVYYAKINSNGTTGSWTTSTYALPVATAYTTATAQNGYLYVLGGSNSGGTEQTTVYFTRLNSDGSTGSWYTTTALPAARSNGKAVSVNGYMYYIGGQSTTDTAQNTTYYSKINSDGTLGAWTAGSTITSARKSAQIVTANGYIYVAGGVDNTGSYQTSVYYATLDPNTGAIGTFASTNYLPGTRAEGSALIANGYMYVIGGRDTSTYQTSVYYSKLSGSDGTAGVWATATNALPATRGGSSSFIANGYMYMIGGYDGSTTTTNTVYSSSVARVQIGASLDLVGLQTTNMTTAGDTAQGSAGGSITAGNGTFIGTMQVQGMTNLSQGLNVNGITTLTGNTYVAGTLSLSSELAAYEGFENVTFPPSGGTGTWTTGGDVSWSRDTVNYEEGIASAASGTILDNQSGWLDVDYTWSQAGSISFAWEASSEAGYDFLVVCIDKDSTCSRTTDYSYRLSGESGWQQLTIPMTAGAHSIRWLYGKDSSTPAGSDKGWVDNVRFNGGEGKIVGNGINFSPSAGYNVTIGDDDTTAALLVLDRYTGSSDPTGTNGGMYYSTYLSKFRCFEASGWHDCAGGNLGYSSVTTAQGGITAAVDLTGFTVDVVVPSSHRVRVSAELSYASTVAGDAPGLSIYDGSSSVYACNIHLVKANESDGIKCDVILEPTPGLHTYKLRGYRAGGTGTISTNVAAGAPGYIMVEDIGGQ